MKKPGEFKVQQKKHQNIQHNRDQLKLLKEEKLEQVELFVLDPDGFKKVTVKKVKDEGYGTPIVYLQKKRNNTKLRTGYLYKEGFHRSISGDNVGRKFISASDVLGVILKIELLKPSELNPFQQ